MARTPSDTTSALLDPELGAAPTPHSGSDWLHLAQVVGGVAAYSFDFTTRSNDWSPSTRAMYGLAADDEITFERWLAAIHPDDAASVRDVMDATMAHGTDVDHVFRIVRGDGAIRTIMDRGRVVRDEAGTPVRLVGINIDITERLAVEEELRFSNGLLHSILASSTDCVKVITLDGRLESMNETGQALMEIDDVTVLVGVCWSGLWPEAARDRVTAAVADAVRGITTRFEDTCPTAKGTPKHWHVTVSPIRNAMGEVVRIASISRDITAEVDARERLALVNQELHHRIKNNLAMTMALARSSLRQASDFAEFDRTFTARMVGLGEIHALLGAGNGVVALGDLLDRQFAPFLDAKPIHFAGPAVLLSEQQAMALAMIVHELITNACKYGGLSEAGRGVGITWSRAPEAESCEVVLEWNETGGNGRAGGSGDGFGSKMITRLAANPLRGRFASRHEADGFRASLTWSLE